LKLQPTLAAPGASVNIFPDGGNLLQSFPTALPRFWPPRPRIVMSQPTMLDRLHSAAEALTPAERQLAGHLRRHYPVAGLASITALARGAGVSSPTVLRLVQKLGFRGYPDFQTALRGEVEEQLISPLAKHDRWAAAAPEGHMLNRFADSVLGNLSATLAQIDPGEFDLAARLLADPARRVFAAGGRITRTLADYLTTHLKIIRSRVALIGDAATDWQPAMLDIAAGDVLVVFDIRRYEPAVIQLAEMAAQAGAEVILVTDQWTSPASAYARLRFSAHVEAPSAWDTTSAILVLVETLLAAVQTQAPEETRHRMARLEDFYARRRALRRTR
jgi:DNA-binding MurR/RpiR family transcriptional regulator